MDRIKVYVSGNDRIADIMERNSAQIKGVVLADEIIRDGMAGYEKDWNINGEDVRLSVERV